MHDVMRKRILRKLESLPEDRLYQVLDYIDFLESKYAPETAPRPTVVQRFGEAVEDGLRALSVGPKAVTGTMRIVGAAGRVFDGLSEAGRELIRGIDEAGTARPRPPAPPRTRQADAGDAAPPGSEAIPRGVETDTDTARPQAPPPPEAGQKPRPDAMLGTDPEREA